MINTLEEIHHGLVHKRHNELKARGMNPDLAALQCELRRRDGLHLSEIEIGEYLGEPLEGNRRGTSKKSQQAHNASCRAAAESAAALDSMPETHAEAAKSHGEAARAHRVAAVYHDEQAEHHEQIANPKSVTDQSKAEEPPLDAEPISCARSLPSLLGDDTATVPDIFMYMPGGIFEITPSQGGRPVRVTVKVDSETAEVLEEQRQILAAGGNPPFISVQHESDVAACWPKRFFWDVRKDCTGKTVAGVWCEGEWTAAGREAVGGKNFRTFSPTFFVNRTTSTDTENPAEVIVNPNARLNLGSVVNDPAFQSISPLWHDTATA